MHIEAKYGLRDKSNIGSVVLGTTGKGTHGSDINLPHFFVILLIF